MHICAHMHRRIKQEKKCLFLGWRCSSGVESLTSRHKLWHFIPAPWKLEMLVYIWSPQTREVKAGGSGVQGLPQLCSEFQPSLGYMALLINMGTQIRSTDGMLVNSKGRPSAIENAEWLGKSQVWITARLHSLRPQSCTEKLECCNSSGLCPCLKNEGDTSTQL